MAEKVKNNDKETLKMDLQKVFDIFDRNKDGSIGTKELRFVIKSFGITPTEDELQDIINEADTNGNGIIDFEEFVNVATRTIKDAEAEDELRQAFRVFDEDENGVISAADLHHAMTHLGDKMSEEEVDEMIREADINNDKQINYEEFITMITSASKLSNLRFWKYFNLIQNLKFKI